MLKGFGRMQNVTMHSHRGRWERAKLATFKYNSKGVLSEEVANVGTSSALTKAYLYDSKGNKVKETISGADVITASTTYGYSGDGKFQTSATNAIGLTETRSYDAKFGTIKTLTGSNGLTTTWDYDGMGRKVKETRADGTKSTWLHRWYGDGVQNNRYVYYVTKLSSGMPSNYMFYDSLGRETTSFHATLGGGRLRTSLKYFDTKGNLIQERLPYVEGVDSINSIDTTYDKFGRRTKITKPGPNNITQTYTIVNKDFTSTVTDANGQKKETVKNAIGQVIKITDALGSGLDSSITYRYDAMGHLLATTDAASNVIQMQYNANGNKVYINDPDLGEWRYVYNAAGKLTSQTNAHGQSTINSYDILGRLVSKSTAEGTSINETTYAYAGIGAAAGSRGKLISTSNSSMLNGTDLHTQTKTLSYDAQGRPLSTTTNIGGRGEYVSSVSYDALSRPSTVTYPNGYQITNAYTDGLLTSVTGSDGKVHYTVNAINAYGSVAQSTFGNGVQTKNLYDGVGYTSTILSGVGLAVLGGVQRLDYSYDVLGNVVSREDNSIEGKHIADTFTYDAMNRLVSQNTDSNVIGNYEKSKVYQYDKLGNMTFQTGIGAYTYYADNPHAVKSAGTRNYTYDNIGNMVNRNGDTIAYNPLNKPAIMTNGKNGKEVRFYYGDGGKRYMKSTADVDTYYLGKSYEEQVKGSEEKQICYISLGGKTIGTHTQVVNTDYVETNQNYAETPFNRYFHTDALGSITAITDDVGNVVERRSYEPFGKIRAMDYGTNNNSLIPNSVIETNRAFTGHEQIAELSGLIHMNARVYDSDIGRFLSADTIIQYPYSSQGYNRYSYIENNPLMAPDPTGHGFFSKLWKKVTKPFKKAWNWVKTNSRFVFATIGAIVTGGFLAPMVLGVGGLGLTGVAYAASAGAAAGAVSGAIATGTIKGALKGALFGGITAGAAFGVAEVTSSVIPGVTSEAAHGASFLENGLTKVTAFKTLGHGLARGAISKLQGQTFKSGFLSGLTSGFDVGTKDYGGIMGRTSIMAIAGGTFSSIGGGKFANGAFGGAMTHLFNHEIGEAMKTKTQMEQNGRKGLSIGHGKGEKGYYVTDSKGFKYASDTPEMRQHLESFKKGMGIPLTVVEVAAGGVIPRLVMLPYEFYSGANFVSTPLSPAGLAGKGYGEFIKE